VTGALTVKSPEVELPKISMLPAPDAVSSPSSTAFKPSVPAVLVPRSIALPAEFGAIVILAAVEVTALLRFHHIAGERETAIRGQRIIDRDSGGGVARTERKGSHHGGGNRGCGAHCHRPGCASPSPNEVAVTLPSSAAVKSKLVGLLAPPQCSMRERR